MREIKFRGKRIDNGEWAYGCLTRYSDRMSYIVVDVTENNGTYQVLTETVGQYTGLKDKNGKDIYEGDVVRKLEWGYIARSGIHDLDEFLRTEKVVSYEEDGDFISYYYESGRDVVTLERFRFWLKNELFGWEGEDLWNPEYCEIIGNIHDHPNILKGDENV